MTNVNIKALEKSLETSLKALKTKNPPLFNEITYYIHSEKESELIKDRDDQLVYADVLLKAIVWTHFARFHPNTEFTYQSYLERSLKESLIWFEVNVFEEPETFEKWWTNAMGPMINDAPFKSSKKALQVPFKRFKAAAQELSLFDTYD